MKKNDERVYVQLLDEAVKVYRPVDVEWVESNLVILLEPDDFDPEDEKWAYPPGASVMVRRAHLGGEEVFVVAPKQDILHDHES